MTGKSAIEWTEQTWNPIVGCSIVSPGCTNCYAMSMAARIEAMGSGAHYVSTTKKMKGKAVWTGKLAQAPAATLLEPLRRKKPTTYFVNSMGDLFHEDCPDEWILEVLDVVRRTSWDGGSNAGTIARGAGQHTYQVLTKRAARMAAFMQRLRFDGDRGLYLSDDGRHPVILKNLWLGVSTERQQEADERIPLLLQTPAAIRFISAEPLLESIDLTELDIDGDSTIDALSTRSPAEHWRDEWAPEVTGTSLEEAIEALEEWGFSYPPSDERMQGLDWVIVGGESGPAARPMHPDWARSLRDQCAAAGVPFFFKQWGEWAPGECAQSAPKRTERTATWFNNRWLFGELTPRTSEETHHDDAPDVYRLGKRAAGRRLDGYLHDAFPKPRGAGHGL
jgi:protein gp37